MTTIGLLHPGEMGAGVGAAARAGGSRVLWASEGRGDDTRRRATGAGLEDVTTVAALVGKSDVVLAVCPRTPRSTSPAQSPVTPSAGCMSTATPWRRPPRGRSPRS